MVTQRENNWCLTKERTKFYKHWRSIKTKIRPYNRGKVPILNLKLYQLTWAKFCIPRINWQARSSQDLYNLVNEFLRPSEWVLEALPLSLTFHLHPKLNSSLSPSLQALLKLLPDSREAAAAPREAARGYRRERSCRRAARAHTRQRQQRKRPREVVVALHEVARGRRDHVGGRHTATLGHRYRSYRCQAMDETVNSTRSRFKTMATITKMIL